MHFHPSSDLSRRPIEKPVFATSRKKSRLSLDKLTVMGVPRSPEVTFTLDGIDGLPEQAHEYLDYHSVPLEENRLTDTLEPFGVRAYIIEPK